MDNRFDLPEAAHGHGPQLQLQGAIDPRQPDNPYAPPVAPIDRAPPPLPKARKPISAWLLQLFAVAGIVLLIFGLYRFASWLWENRGLDWKWGVLLLELGWRVVVLAMMAGALVGTQRRAAYGRWLGLACIAQVFAILVYTHITRSSRADAVIAASSDAAEKAGETMGAFLILGLVVWWFYAFGFSAKARRYFQNAGSV